MKDSKTKNNFLYNRVPPSKTSMGSIHLLRLLRSRYTSGRSIFQPEGNDQYEFVRIGNLLANRVALLIWVATAYGLRWLLEQPEGSALPDLPRFQQLWRAIQVGLNLNSVLFYILVDCTLMNNQYVLEFPCSVNVAQEKHRNILLQQYQEICWMYISPVYVYVSTTPFKDYDFGFLWFENTFAKI